jgi:glutamate racemase
MKIKIGIFDSGIGGFTILDSLLKTRRDLQVFYLADTKRVPYGEKNVEQMRSIAKEICCWFEDKNLDALLIACNTTNACALDILENFLGIPVSETELIRSKTGIPRKFSNISKAHAFVVLQAINNASKFLSSNQQQISFAIDLICSTFFSP